jgi:hypothetical protein
MFRHAAIVAASRPTGGERIATGGRDGAVTTWIERI